MLQGKRSGSFVSGITVSIILLKTFCEYLRSTVPERWKIPDKGQRYMEEHTYYISEVSKLVGVEPHVLRYWEEELGLKISRDSQGKRCYTRKDVECFQEAKRWKDKGMQLKAVKEILEEGIAGQRYREHEAEREWSEGRSDDASGREDEKAGAEEETCRDRKCGEEEQLQFELVTLEEPSDSMKKFEYLLDSLISRALERNNENLVREICDEIFQRLEEQIEEKVRDTVEQELMQEMLREGERETAAAGQKQREGLWRRWKRSLEKYWDL